jgi:regulatory protein
VANVGSVDAFEIALRALAAHDRTAAELDARLERRGLPAEEREEALERLEQLGYIDDARVARDRAAQLADRGSGNALIRHDLEGRGIAAEAIEDALRALEPERVRAARVVATRGRSARTARYLASRGFGEDTVAALVARDD